MSDDQSDSHLPDTQVSPDDPPWIDNTDLDVVVVHRYDTDDIMVGRQYLVVVHDDSEDGQFVISSVARPPEPASI